MKWPLIAASCDRYIFVQSRVISVQSWYLTSLINLSFCEISGAFGANLTRTLGGRIFWGKPTVDSGVSPKSLLTWSLVSLLCVYIIIHILWVCKMGYFIKVVSIFGAKHRKECALMENTWLSLALHDTIFLLGVPIGAPVFYRRQCIMNAHSKIVSLRVP